MGSIEQPPLEGFPNIPATYTHLPATKPPELGVRNAAVRMFFPNYFGINEAEIAAGEFLPQDDTSTVFLSKTLVGRPTGKNTMKIALSPNSDRVLLSPVEAATILEYPNALHRRVEARYHNTEKARFLNHDELAVEAYRSGGHAVENRIPPMDNLLISYNGLISSLRVLQRGLQNPINAITIGDEMLASAVIARKGFHDMLASIAIAQDWSADRLDESHTVLDWRLMGGRGQERLRDKKLYWQAIVKTLGNYTIAKKALVNDRLQRSRAVVESMPEKVR